MYLSIKVNLVLTTHLSTNGKQKQQHRQQTLKNYKCDMVF